MATDRFPITITVSPDDAGQRLDQFLTTQIPDISRSRVQQLLTEQKALVDGSAAKPSLKLRGGEQITILGDPQPPPLRAIAEDIPLDIIFEDSDLAVVNKPAGMMVHAGAGSTDDERNRGTLVNALLHRFAKLSDVGGELRPGIVHRLDKETSGLILIAKNDVAHRKLGQQFSGRNVKKRYVALIHGWPEKDRGTINSPISRDEVRRIRMTTRGRGGRTALTHYEVRERIASVYGKSSLAHRRSHRDRAHSPDPRPHGVARASGTGRHPLRRREGHQAWTCEGPPSTAPGVISLPRNFLHAAAIEFTHPRTGKPLSF